MRRSHLRRTLPILLLASCCPLRAAVAPPVTALTHVNVIDVVKGTIAPDQTLLARDGKIAGLSHRLVLPKDAQVVDGTGKYAIPGLWDMHYHFEGSKVSDREVAMLLANGVLGIRDMGDNPEAIFAARTDFASGKRLGPRVVACGPIVDGPQPTNPPLSVSVSGAEDGRRTVRELKAQGADCIKVHDGVPRDAYFAIADEAKQVHLPLVGHIPVRVRVMEAIDAGQKTVEHQIGLRGASTAEAEVIEAETTADVFGQAMRTKNYGLIPESIAANGNRILDHITSELATRLYGAMARGGTCLDPTLVTDRAMTYVDDLVKETDPRSKYIPAAQREWWNPERGMLTRYRTPAYIAFRKRQFEVTLQQIPLAHRQGVRFLAGTDTTLPFVYPGFSVHDEMALFVRAGLSPLEALRTATVNAAACLGIEPTAGTLEVGKDASVVLLDRNPLDDITATKTIDAVIVRGRILRRSELANLLQGAEAAAVQP